MNILFLTIVRINDISERGIYTDLMRKFRDENHLVYIACPSERRYKEKTSLISIDGVKILKITTLNIQKTNLLEKGVSTLLLENQFLKAIKNYYSAITFDLVIYSTPPITFTKIISYIKKRDSANSYLLLKDIFPQNAVDLGMIKKNGLIYRYFKNKEAKLYAISDYIGCMSPANVNYILEHNKKVSPLKIEVNPNSIDPIANCVTYNEKVKIRKNYNIPQNAVVFIYGGNLGKPQGISFLIDVLKSNSKNLDIFFVIVGNGTEYPNLKEWFQQNKPGNAILLQSLPKNVYDVLLSSCDVGLIFLDEKFTIPNFPSRLLSYLERKIPVVAATDSSTDLGKIMVENNFGIWCLNGDLMAFNNALTYFSNDVKIRNDMGINGYNFLMENYLTKHSYQIIVNHFL